MINPKRLNELFLKLVDIPGSSKNERHIADFLRAHITDMGFAVQEDTAAEKVGGTQGNLLIKIPGTADGPTLLLSAHLDTVVAGGVVEAIEDNGVIRSKGETILGADDRAGLGAILEVVQTLTEKKTPHPPILLVLTVCEEIGLLGATHLNLSESDASMGVMLDTSGPIGTIVNRAPFHESWMIEITGKSAHAGIEPEKGINALLLASSLLPELPNGRINDTTTANVARISGGGPNNIVPKTVKIYGEYRAVEKSDLTMVAKSLVTSVEAFNTKHGECATYKVHREYNGYSLPLESPVIQRLSAAATSIGKEPYIKATGGGSDANVLNARGIPCSVISCGMQNAHTKDECITLEDLRDTARMLYAFVTLDNI